MLKLKPGKDSCQGDSGGPFTVDVEGQPLIGTFIIIHIFITQLLLPIGCLCRSSEPRWQKNIKHSNVLILSSSPLHCSALSWILACRPAPPCWSCFLGLWMRKGDWWSSSSWSMMIINAYDMIYDNNIKGGLAQGIQGLYGIIRDYTRLYGIIRDYTGL